MKNDAIGKIGFSSYQKCNATARMFAYKVDNDLVDEYMHMSKCTCLQAMYKFRKAMVQVFAKDYLREPNSVDRARLLESMLQEGFLRCLGA